MMEGNGTIRVEGRSPNPGGRPRGTTSLEAYLRDPDWFIILHGRWWKFCRGLMEPPYNQAAAARYAGYSPKSARFIGCRLWKKPVIREMFRLFSYLVDSSTIVRDPVSGERTVIYRHPTRKEYYKDPDFLQYRRDLRYF